MSYPIYKLLRAVNRQYPNNGFINYVDVREDMYNHDLIDEDLRDLINETIQEVYKDVAIDEVYSFPTVPGQNQYVLPEDCDLRDIQEVTRTYQGVRGPLCPPPPAPPIPTVFQLFFDNNGKVIVDGAVRYLSGTGEMEPMEAEIGSKIILPECEFEPPEGYTFKAWEINGVEYLPGSEFELQGNFIATPIWYDVDPGPVWEIVVTLKNVTNDDKYVTVAIKPINGELITADLYHNNSYDLSVGENGTLGEVYEYVTASFSGTVFQTLDLTTVYTENTTIPLAHPSVEPDVDPGTVWEDPEVTP